MTDLDTYETVENLRVLFDTGNASLTYINEDVLSNVNKFLRYGVSYTRKNNALLIPRLNKTLLDFLTKWMKKPPKFFEVLEFELDLKETDVLMFSCKSNNSNYYHSIPKA